MDVTHVRVSEPYLSTYYIQTHFVHKYCLYVCTYTYVYIRQAQLVREKEAFFSPIFKHKLESLELPLTQTYKKKLFFFPFLFFAFLLFFIIHTYTSIHIVEHTRKGKEEEEEKFSKFHPPKFFFLLSFVKLHEFFHFFFYERRKFFHFN